MKITKTLTAMAVALAATTGTSAVALDELVVGTLWNGQLPTNTLSTINYMMKH